MKTNNSFSQKLIDSQIKIGADPIQGLSDALDLLHARYNNLLNKSNFDDKNLLEDIAHGLYEMINCHHCWSETDLDSCPYNHSAYLRMYLSYFNDK